MKNLNTNESTSFESSLGSPTKPLLSYDAQKPKQLFFVNSVEDTHQSLENYIINLGPVPKPCSTEKKNIQKKKIKFESKLKPPKIKNNKNKKHILDFDALFRNIILQKNKGEKSQNKKRNNSGIHSKNKFVGSKRIRNVSNKSINTKNIPIKKKKIDNKISSNKAKGKSTNNNTNSNNNHSNLYDINNFFSSAIKIREKSIFHNVICPSFEELSPEFFEDNKIEDNEDISDEAYLKYHNVFEQKEIDYRIQVCNNLDKKKSKKELKKEIVETQKAYKNLYTSENIDNNKDTEAKDSNNTIYNTNNIIKINLASLEFEQNE